MDTSALLALRHARDQHHARAVEIAGRHRAAGGWLARYEDQPFSLVDAVNFEVMRS